MPSKKKTRARQRRANREEEQTILQQTTTPILTTATTTTTTNSKCLHGCSNLPPDAGHEIYHAYRAWMDAVVQQQFAATSGTRAILDIVLPVYPDIIRNDETRAMMKSLLIASAMNCLLLLLHPNNNNNKATTTTDDDHSSKWVVARQMAEAVLTLEDYERCEESTSHGEDMPLESKQFKRMRDLYGDGHRGVTRFFAKRISCSCLDENHRGDGVGGAKSQPLQPSKKKGTCFYCKEERDMMELKKCSRCKLAHYCSHQCQKAHWPIHKKDICKEWGNNNAANS